MLSLGHLEPAYVNYVMNLIINPNHTTYSRIFEQPQPSIIKKTHTPFKLHIHRLFKNIKITLPKLAQNNQQQIPPWYILPSNCNISLLKYPKKTTKSKNTSQQFVYSTNQQQDSSGSTDHKKKEKLTCRNTLPLITRGLCNRPQH